MNLLPDTLEKIVETPEQITFTVQAFFYIKKKMIIPNRIYITSFAFKGWSNGDFNIPFTLIIPIWKDHTFYAVWEPNN